MLIATLPAMPTSAAPAPDFASAPKVEVLSFSVPVSVFTSNSLMVALMSRPPTVCVALPKVASFVTLATLMATAAPTPTLDPSVLSFATTLPSAVALAAPLFVVLIANVSPAVIDTPSGV